MLRYLLLALAMAVGPCLAQIARPSTYWFGKAVTAERSRQFYVGLNAEMWVLYDLPQAVLYQAWKGGALGGSLASASVAVTPEYWFKGGPHFPHIYVPGGAEYFHDAVGEYFASYTKPEAIDLYYTKWPKQPLGYKAWSVLNGTTDAGARIRFRGYALKGNAINLQYGLALPAGGEIAITESPEYSNAGGKNMLVRTFTFAGIPAGYQVRLLKPGGAASAWAVTSGDATFASGCMTQTANGRTVLTGSW